ncbi:hypothetical protein F2P81_022575 [Scophthalmus maximus]|uniref:Uncharacterized protein n=1 Tax=Scophthalmus maximus TaxID=52904 RepID=A0A6A4S587_SCOMX|nr:hypothetical protein F2P81_022575 [Scophthalmus maximus]
MASSSLVLRRSADGEAVRLRERVPSRNNDESSRAHPTLFPPCKLISCPSSHCGGLAVVPDAALTSLLKPTATRTPKLQCTDRLRRNCVRIFHLAVEQLFTSDYTTCKYRFGHRFATDVLLVPTL